jgi:hypothetical protein
LVQAMHGDLIATLVNEAVAYSRVTKYLRTAQFNPTKVFSNPDAGSCHLDDSDRGILAALEEKPFSSVRELARATHLPATTVYRRLINSHWLGLRHLRWARHPLSDAQKLSHAGSEIPGANQKLLPMAWHSGSRPSTEAIALERMLVRATTRS